MTRELPLLATDVVARNLRNGTQTQDRRPKRDQRQPYPWRPGGLLYVREPTLVLDVRSPGTDRSQMLVRYDSNGTEHWVPWPSRIKAPVIGRRLANGCYREAAQTWLRVLDVRPENGDITEEDAIAEGLRNFGDDEPDEGCWWLENDGLAKAGATATEGFALLWDSLYGAGSWAKRPWRWRTVVELDRERSGLTVVNG